MAKDTRGGKPLVLPTIGGVDESVDLADPSGNLVDARGVFPFFNGMHHRMFGKKIIDYNQDQSIYAIHQAFNGICLYGYYVQTSEKLYFHLCTAPPDLRIHFHGQAQYHFADSDSIHWRLI
jgi:hypothetical protein